LTDHGDLVATIKPQLVGNGLDLAGPCGAFAITKRVAWALRSEGAGLLDKPGGNQCEGYATDIVMYPDGRLVDILGDGGGANSPMWNETGEIRPTSQYRPAINPGDVVGPPVDPPGPKPPDSPDAFMTILLNLDLKFDQLAMKVDALGEQLDALKDQSNANTEKIQTQINQVVKNGEQSLAALLPLLKGGGGLTGIFGKKKS